MTYAERQAFYKSAVWSRFRLMVLNGEPLCRSCKRQAATEVDHIEDLADRPDKALDRDNVQPLCIQCHSRKTAMTIHQRNKLVGKAIKVRRPIGE